MKFHLTNIYRKLDVSNRTEAVRYAYEHGIVERPLYHVVFGATNRWTCIRYRLIRPFGRVGRNPPL